MDTIQIAKLFFLLFLTNLCIQMCYPSPWRTTYQPVFLPGPQFCPETGRTVCTAVDYYPTDQIYHLLTLSRSQGFNLTSLFVDERRGDIEPNLTQLPTPKPYYQNGYGNNQPPPGGGRFSPAGYNNWNVPTSDKPPDYSGMQPERWRQVDQPPGDGGALTSDNGGKLTPNTGGARTSGNSGGLTRDNGGMLAPGNGDGGTLSPGGVSRTGGVTRNSYVNTAARQSRAQHLSNQRRTLNLGRNPTVPQRLNYNQRSRQTYNQGAEENFTNNGYGGETQYNRMDPKLQNVPFENSQQYGGRNFTSHFPQDVQYPQEPHQIQPPFIQHRIKGHNPQSVITMKPPAFGNWKGAPTHGDYVDEQSARFNTRRDRRNQDVEVACEVRSTYVPPRAALSDNSEWKYIVNVPERDRRFTQVVRVDICLNAGESCSSRFSLPFGFESRCRQKYIKKKLLSLNSDGQGTSEDNFFIPSCCVCEITRPNSRK